MCVVPPTSPSARVTPRSRARAWSSITSASSATAAGEPASARLLEPPQPVRDQDTARGRRRVRDELCAAVGRAQRPAPDHAVALEVVGRDRGNGAHELPRHFTGVDRGRAVFRDSLERSGELGPDQPVAGLESVARRRREHRREDPVEVRLPLGHLEAAVGELDRGLQQLRPRQRAVRAVRGLRGRPRCPVPRTSRGRCGRAASASPRRSTVTRLRLVARAARARPRRSRRRAFGGRARCGRA